MISRRIYLTIFILMSMVFVMFMFVGVSSNILSDTTTNSRAEDKVDIKGNDILTADSLNMDTGATSSSGTGTEVFNSEQKLRVAILSGGSEDAMARILTEWCVYNKYLYKIYTSLPDAEKITDFDIILFSEYNITVPNYEILYEYAKLGITMIFANLPEYEEIQSQKTVADFYGIKEEVNANVEADGIKIFSDFMISEEKQYHKGDFFGEKDDTAIQVPYYSLAEGYEIYAVGTFENQKELGIEDKDLPPLLWRTTTEKAFVFVVNSDIFKGVSMLGILTGFMTHQSEFYLYPIINAQTISLLNYPYLSDENMETMQRLYSRSSEAVSRDILWPNIVQILKNYGKSYSFFAASQLDYLDNVDPKEDYIKFYLQEIGKLPGDMGLSLDQVSKTDLNDLISKNKVFFEEYLPEYYFTALYAADFSTDEVLNGLDNEFLKNISLVMSNYKEGDELVSFLNNDVLSVKFNLNGYQHETMDDLQMSCIENALGMCNEMVDIGRVIYPESSLDEWNNLSLIWSRGDTYFKDYSELDMVSIYEMEKRIRRFLALDFSYQYIGKNINIQINNFDEEAYFIVCINNKEIDSVKNASIKKISENNFLIKALNSKVSIQLKEKHYLEKPKNNKIIPSNP